MLPAGNNWTGVLMKILIYMILFLVVLLNSVTVWAENPPSGCVSGLEIPRKIEKVYYLDGALFSETDLFSDRYNGFYRTFHPNGRLASEVRYKNGFQIYDKAFDDEGNPIHREGVVRTHYADGTLYEATEYHNDKKNGRERIYYYDGTTLVAERFYSDGRKVDVHKIYDEAGRFMEDEDWGYPTSYIDELRRERNAFAGLCLLLVGAVLLAGGSNRKRKADAGKMS